jgi:CheY-like chemotaxis protein
MKKVLLAKEVENLFTKKSGFLGRSDIKAFTAVTNDEVLKVHRREKVDLIVTQLDLPGIKSEDLFSIIRNSEELRDVSTIIICKDTLAHRMRCRQCRANAVFTTPIDVPLLYIKAHHFLDIAPRKSYRAALAVGIQGSFKDKPRPFWTENISASGMLIRSEEPLSKGDGTYFSFFLPDGTHVSGYGEITRAERLATTPETFLYGIKFTNIDPEVKTAIEAVVNKMQS